MTSKKFYSKEGATVKRDARGKLFVWDPFMDVWVSCFEGVKFYVGDTDTLYSEDDPLHGPLNEPGGGLQPDFLIPGVGIAPKPPEPTSGHLDPIEKENKEWDDAEYEAWNCWMH